MFKKHIIAIFMIAIIGVFFGTEAQAIRTFYNQTTDGGGLINFTSPTASIYTFTSPFNVSTGTVMTTNSWQLRPTAGVCSWGETIVSWRITDSNGTTVISGAGLTGGSFTLGEWGAVSSTPEVMAKAFFTGANYEFIPNINCGGSPTADVRFDTANTDLFGLFIMDEEEDILTIDYPLNNESNNDFPVINMTGKCSTGLDLSIFDGVTTASSTFLVQSSLSCDSDQWFFPLLAPAQGFYNILATSTNAVAGSVFFYSAESQEFIPITATSTFDLLEGGEGGFWTFLYNNFVQNYLKLRPYSYFSDIYHTVGSSTANLTSTSPFPELDFTIVAGGATTSFDLETIEITDVYDVLPQAGWQTLRILFNIVLYISFVFFLYRRIKRLI